MGRPVVCLLTSVFQITWLGATDSEVEGTWKWSKPGGQTFWTGGNPTAGGKVQCYGHLARSSFLSMTFPSPQFAVEYVLYRVHIVYDDQFLMCRRSLASSLVGCPPSQTVLGHRSKTVSSYRWGQGQGQVYPLFISVSCCQSCPTLHVQDDGEWNDQLCSKTAQYMCETPAIQGGAELVVPTTPKPVVAGQINTSFSTYSPPSPQPAPAPARAAGWMQETACVTSTAPPPPHPHP